MKETMRGDKPKRLSLTPVREGLRRGMRSNGRKYSVREDRGRIFFPEEWVKFYKVLKDDQKPIFSVLINTGARIEEALSIRPMDFDWDRNNLTLRTTKRRAAKHEWVGKPRTFQISSQFARRMKSHILKNKIKPDQRIFKKCKQGVWQLMRRKLRKARFKDYWNFGLHNIRKTHGNWLKAMDIRAEEICLRLGHDFDTYLRHYGSANIFDRKDKMLMVRILGDLYGFK